MESRDQSETEVQDGKTSVNSVNKFFYDSNKTPKKRSLCNNFIFIKLNCFSPRVKPGLGTVRSENVKTQSEGPAILSKNSGFYLQTPRCHMEHFFFALVNQSCPILAGSLELIVAIVI